MGRAQNIPEKQSYFLPYQEAWIKDKSFNKLMEKSRQIGLSFSSAYALVRAQSLSSCRTDAWISSRDAEQAENFIRDCRKFTKQLNAICSDLRIIPVTEDGAEKGHEITFANGKRIVSMSSSPDAQSGKVGLRVLDEFALNPRNKELLGYAQPGTTWSSDGVHIISTHRGEGNLFNRLVKEVREGGNPKRFSLHRITLEDALDQGFLWKLQSVLPTDDFRQDMDEQDYYDYVRAGCVSEENFQEEYMCNPSSDETAYLTWDLISRALYLPSHQWEHHELDGTKKYCIGMDIGRKSDLTAISIIEINGEMRSLRKMVTMKKARFRDQLYELGRWAKQSCVTRVCIDSTGMGAMLAEEARLQYGSKVEEIHFTDACKEDMATVLKRTMEDGQLRIPDDAALLGDLRSIRKYVTSSKHDRFDAERNEQGHADRFWALALAIHAAHRPNGWTFAPIAC